MFSELKYEDFCRASITYLRQIAEFMHISPDVSMERTYGHIDDGDYKFTEALDRDIQQEVIHIMEPALRSCSYL